MSTKRESDKATTRISGEDDTIGVETTTTTASSSLSEQRHSVERVIDETKDNLKKQSMKQEERFHEIQKQLMIIKNILCKQLKRLQIVT